MDGFRFGGTVEGPVRGRRWRVRKRVLAAVAALILSLPTLTAPVTAAAGPASCSVGSPVTFKGIITNADRLAAAQRAAAARAACTAAGGGKVTPSTGVTPGLLGTPDYFGNSPNYANSPLPTSGADVGFSGGGGTGAVASATVTNGVVTTVAVTNGGSGYTSPPSVSLTGGHGAGAVATATITGSVTAVQITNGGHGYTTAPSVAISGDGSGATAAATIVGDTVSSITIGNVGAGYTVANVVISGVGTGAAATAVITGTVAAVTVVNGGAGYATGGIRKFVDSLPGLGSGGANDLGQYLSVAVPDQTTYPGSDYYEIAVIQYRQKLSSDLPATLLRGYVQLETPVNKSSSKSIPLANANLDGSSTPILDSHGHQVYGYDGPQYLGPTILAQTNVPVRVKFTDYLPTGVPGNLFIPVDTSVMGAGEGPLNAAGNPCDPATDTTGTCASYSQNRATLHLHGGVTPWISDGTPNQWITPAGEVTKYPKGVSVVNVPDMPDPGPGSETFFYTNQQSARLMFYHDHAYGITRLNVYSGEAAGYLLQDSTEAQLVANGLIPANEMPLVIQDKTFVPGPTQLAQEDPTWNTSLYGGQGNLWFPHVYMPNQNPVDAMGVNAMGRWDYGPWFWPPYVGLANGTVANPLAGSTPEEGPTIPGIPNPSIVPEAFMDTPLVNGTAYPYVQVGKKAYRFRILNASNDRTLNLQLYCAASNGQMWDVNGMLVNPGAGEVPMVSAAPGIPGTQGYSGDILDGRVGGVPNVAAGGPTMIQIGTEGGFLPNPVTMTNSPIGYEYNRRSITVLNVASHNLMLGPAERADIIVDFSQVDLAKCSNILLYNDAPAPVPAFDSRYDYFTGDPDQTSTGGAPTTMAGFGPNTRTIMQFRVKSSLGVSPAFNAAALKTALPQAFAATQAPIIVPEPAYNSVYGQSFSSNYVNIQNTKLTFTPLNSSTPITMDLQPKAIQELFETMYGRMNATLGTELPNTTGVNQTTIPLGYAEPVTEVLVPSDVGTPVGSLGDGTQIWKITHNGVDTHFIHFHLFNVQVINRVGWDGMVKPPDANELGWKETVRMNPLEDTIVALRPVAPKVPFGLPDSVRLIDVARPPGVSIATFDTATGNPTTVSNTLQDYGWEYVWHCHILGHEENDMMRPVEFNVPSALATKPILTLSASSAGSGSIALFWTDGTPPNPAYGKLGSTWGDQHGEIGYRIYRSTALAGPYVQVGTALANQTTYTDTSVTFGSTYYYEVTAFNQAGDSTSDPVAAPTAATVPSAPLNPAAVAGNSSATVTWSAPLADGDSPIASYTVTPAGGPGTPCTLTLPGALSCTVTGLTNGLAYTFTVTATNGVGTGPASAPSAAVTPSTVPGKPTGVTGIPGNGQVTVSWTAPADSGGLPTTGYNAIALVGGVASGQSCGTTGATTCTINSLTNGVAYTFTVTASNTLGPGAPSDPSSPVTPGPVAPGKPSGVTATAGNASAVVTWVAPLDNGGSPVTGYTVTSTPDGLTCTTTGALTCTVNGLANGTPYTFTVTAANTFGTGPASDPSTAVVPEAPWTVILGPSSTIVSAGTAVLLTAQANQNVGPTPYFVVILASDGSVLSACGFSSTCTASVNSNTAGLSTFTAVVGSATGTSPVATSYPVSVRWTPVPATFHAISPMRVLDSRIGTGLIGPFSPHVARTFHVTGLTGLPSIANAVTGNLTVTQQSGPGYFYVGPVATTNPTSSTLNFPLKDDRANGVTVALGVGGTLSITFVSPVPGATAHAIFDVTGYFTPDSSGATYHSLIPTRILDSRSGLGLPAALRTSLPGTFQVTGIASGVPSTASAVTGNLTVTRSTGSGYVFAGPTATISPTSSTLNFPLRDDRANGVTVALGTGGTLSVTYVSGTPGATTDVIFDVTGYFATDPGGASFVPLAPSRILDTRIGNGLPGLLQAHLAQTFQVTGGLAEITPNATAVTGNLTVTGQASGGFIFLGPGAINNPTSSTLNFPINDDRANGVTVALGSGGTLSITYVGASPSATTQAIFDLTGYFAP